MFAHFLKAQSFSYLFFSTQTVWVHWREEGRKKIHANCCCWCMKIILLSLGVFCVWKITISRNDGFVKRLLRDFTTFLSAFPSLWTKKSKAWNSIVVIFFVASVDILRIISSNAAWVITVVKVFRLLWKKKQAVRFFMIRASDMRWTAQMESWRERETKTPWQAIFLLIKCRDSLDTFYSLNDALRKVNWDIVSTTWYTTVNLRPPVPSCATRCVDAKKQFSSTWDNFMNRKGNDVNINS